MTFNSLSRDHYRRLSFDWDVKYRHLSTPSLGITESDTVHVQGAVIKLSTPSLGITFKALDCEYYRTRKLSTPSLGITEPSE